MALSVVDPISPAIERTRQILFQPFDLSKWLTLGFTAFLMQLGQGGGGGFNFPGGGPGGGVPGDRVAEWFRENWLLIAVVVAILLLLGLAIGLLLTWLSSRGHFMFLDNVVHNRAEVVAPWRQFRAEGNSLFWFRICLGIAALLAFLLIGGLGVLIAWRDIQAREFGGFAASGIAAGISLFMLLVFSLVIASVLLNDFVVPIMYHRRLGAVDSWREFFSSLLAGRVGLFVLYLLMKIVISMVVGFLAMAALCLTCCLAAIPYLGTVILLPIPVFMQCYTLYFLEQFGPEWKFFPEVGTNIGPDEPPNPFRGAI